MYRKSIRKICCLAACVILMAAMALTFTACGQKAAPETTAPVLETTAPAGTSFQVVVTDLDGKETTFDDTTDKATVGEALLEKGLIAGEEGEYGLYVSTVNGITLDWDKDQKYWAFYIDGEYAQTGVDSTNVTEGAVYSFKPEG